MTQTGGDLIHELCEKAGEPLIPEVAALMGEKRGEREAVTASELWEQNAERLAYASEYERAWNETAKQSQCKRPMDGLLMPISGVVGWERGAVNYCGTLNDLTQAIHRLEIPCITPVLQCRFTMRSHFLKKSVQISLTTQTKVYTMPVSPF